MLFVMNPAASSIIDDSAISPTTIARLSLPTRSDDAACDSSLRIVLISSRAEWMAGSNPDTKLASTATPSTKTSTAT